MTDSDFIRELIECPVCLEQLDADSRVLPCQHTFCKRCLQGIVETHKELRCPECRIVVTSEVCDLPTNILLIRLLDALKRNPKFVPRNTRCHRRNSRPAFRIAKEIFFQSPSRPLPQITTSTTHARRSADTGDCRSFVYPVDQRPLNFPISSSNRATRSTSGPCPPAANGSANCYAVPSRRKEQSTSQREPRVVPADDASPVAGPGPRATSSLHVNTDMGNSSINLLALNQSPLVTSSPFARSSSHDYLVGVQQIPWNGVPVVPSSGRTKSLSRPSSRKSEKHATLPPRITISPNQLETFARSMSHGLSVTETPKSLFSTSMTIGNPLYGFTTERHSVEHKNVTTVKPAIHANETRLRAMDPLFVSVSGRRVKALYTCVGETVNELSFEADAIITDVLESGEDGWLIGTYRGRRGLVPLNYVQDIPPQVTD